jgi:hypothetical protein
MSARASGRGAYQLMTAPISIIITVRLHSELTGPPAAPAGMVSSTLTFGLRP